MHLLRNRDAEALLIYIAGTPALIYSAQVSWHGLIDSYHISRYARGEIRRSDVKRRYYAVMKRRFSRSIMYYFAAGLIT